MSYIIDHRVHTNGPLRYVIHPSISIIIDVNAEMSIQMNLEYLNAVSKDPKTRILSHRENKRHSDPGRDDDSVKYVCGKLGPE